MKKLTVVVLLALLAMSHAVEGPSWMIELLLLNVDGAVIVAEKDDSISDGELEVLHLMADVKSGEIEMAVFREWTETIDGELLYLANYFIAGQLLRELERIELSGNHSDFIKEDSDLLTNINYSLELVGEASGLAGKYPANQRSKIYFYSLLLEGIIYEECNRILVSADINFDGLDELQKSDPESYKIYNEAIVDIFQQLAQWGIDKAVDVYESVYRQACENEYYGPEIYRALVNLAEINPNAITNLLVEERLASFD